MFTAKCCVTSAGAVARSVVRVLALASFLAVASASDFFESCHGGSAAEGKALMQMVAKTEPATPPLQLSGMIGGLQAEYFYFSSGLQNVAALDGAVADLTRAEEDIYYESTGSAWPGVAKKDKFGAIWSGGLRITTAGTYTLETRSDDGSVVMVDGAV
eukprot:6486738-Amphidinium_carterae.1